MFQFVLNLILSIINMSLSVFKRKAVSDSSETKRAKYDKNTFDRFGDDLCGLLLSYLGHNEKLRYECVSKQWQRCIYVNERRLNCKAKHNSLAITRTLVLEKPEILDLIVRKFNYIRVLDVHFIVGTKSALHLIKKLPFLEEIGLYGYRNDSMKFLCESFNKHIPLKIKRIRFCNELLVPSISTFQDFGKVYNSRTTGLNLRLSFNENRADPIFEDQCVDELVLYKKLQYLTVASPLNGSQVVFIGRKLPLLKRVELKVLTINTSTLYSTTSQYSKIYNYCSYSRIQ